MSDIKDRIEYLMNYHNLNANSLAKELGMKNSTTMHAILKGKSKPSYPTLAMLLTRFKNVDAEWLMTGNGSMLKELDVSHHRNVSGDEARHIRESLGYSVSEFADVIELGSNVTVYNNESRDYVTNSYQKLIEPFIPRVGVGLIKKIVHRSSMEPEYPLGSEIELEEVRDFRKFLEPDLAYYIETSDQELFKYLKLKDEETFIAYSKENSFELKKDLIQKIYRVVSVKIEK